jgi:hypothetical protein
MLGDQMGKRAGARVLLLRAAENLESNPHQQRRALSRLATQFGLDDSICWMEAVR